MRWYRRLSGFWKGAIIWTFGWAVLTAVLFGILSGTLTGAAVGFVGGIICSIASYPWRTMRRRYRRRVANESSSNPSADAGEYPGKSIVWHIVFLTGVVCLLASLPLIAFVNPYVGAGAMGVALLNSVS